jgi:hypothetical protein
LIISITLIHISTKDVFEETSFLGQAKSNIMGIFAFTNYITLLFNLQYKKNFNCKKNYFKQKLFV